MSCYEQPRLSDLREVPAESTNFGTWWKDSEIYKTVKLCIVKVKTLLPYCWICWIINMLTVLVPLEAGPIRCNSSDMFWIQLNTRGRTVIFHAVPCPSPQRLCVFQLVITSLARFVSSVSKGTSFSQYLVYFHPSIINPLSSDVTLFPLQVFEITTGDRRAKVSKVFDRGQLIPNPCLQQRDITDLRQQANSLRSTTGHFLSSKVPTYGVCTGCLCHLVSIVLLFWSDTPCHWFAHAQLANLTVMRSDLLQWWGRIKVAGLNGRGWYRLDLRPM